MNDQASAIKALAAAGAEALRAGDAKSARDKFEAVTGAGFADATVWHSLALACRQLGDFDAMLRAADRALTANERHIPSLMLKGDHYASIGDDRAALSHYNAVVKLSASTTARTPEMVQAERRAHELRARYKAKMFAHLSDSLAAAGFERGTSSERFAHALDMLMGERRPYLQQPRMFYFPELPNVEFFPRQLFPWIEALEAATDDIRAELAAVMPSEGDFVPYLRPEQNRPSSDASGLLNSKDWSAFFLLRDGVPVAENVARCPKTMAALSAVPLTQIKGRCPMALFSRLLPGAKIPPHHGFLNTRLVCHLPLIVPPGCRFRVGNERREWREGQVWVFDDTIEHEASNPTQETRVILIFEVWRPELSEEERALVATLIEAVDTYAGDARQSWND